MAGLNFKVKTLRHASDMNPEDLPPVVGKGKILVAYDDIMAGIPKQAQEEDGGREIKATPKSDS